MSGIVTDLAVNPGAVPWRVYSGGKNTFTITVTQSDVAFSLASRTFTLVIRRIGSESDFITLTQVSGITNGGASGILTILLTAAQAATLGNDSYFWQLSCTTDETRWLAGTITATTRVPDGEAATSLSVSIPLSGTNINLEIGLGGAASGSYRGTVSIASGDFPEEGGTGDPGTGDLAVGDWLLTSDSGTLLDRNEDAMEVPIHSMLWFTGGEFQLGASWKINQG